MRIVHVCRALVALVVLLAGVLLLVLKAWAQETPPAPDTFLTLETLKTLAGQVLVVGMITQAVKSAAPALATYWIRLVAIGSGVFVHGALVWTAGMGPGAYILALANGTLVAMAAMKGVELVKGERPAG